ncbi:hypothetical protein A1D22_00910 [Pasteurellaceae bacterium LFhippo2]|nr:hypothetical protein [Pasteurellaceae bacterium LFhippo2]
MKKRNLFNELMQGLEEMQAHLNGEIELPSYTLSRPNINKSENIEAEELKNIRSNLNLSQRVFSELLKTNVKTYQKWELGKSKPNQLAVFFIRLAERDPDLFYTVVNTKV